ncbi:MAG: aminopeptidase P family protein [Candidatus Aminicenantes bacterium]|nr:aminopeptidase P family protein [Candidatus Aminicenantes bacterium]
MLIKEKINQAIEIMKEKKIGCWITFVRESGILHDPMLDFLTQADVTWHSAFIVTPSGETFAIVGQMDRKTIEDFGVYTHVLSYVEGIKEHLTEAIKKIDPASIALNYSTVSEISDGLTHGMYLTMREILSEIGYADKMISAEEITSSLKARKTDNEIQRMKKAIEHTLDIYAKAASFIAPGKTEKEIAAFMIAEVEKRNLGFAWERSHCPAVFTGPATAEAHYTPTDRKVERSHVLNMDFGVKFEDYCSDIQRTYYILEEGETEAPAEVRKGFETIRTSIELARKAIKPGVQGVEIDKIAREYIVSQGYEEYPHALGHQVGRFAHDGTALLGPAWEKYAQKPFLPLEEGMVFTIEPRLRVPDRGIVTIEEMVVITKEGAEYLAEPQEELILIG